jgi:peptide/nickel transport system permease protein
MAVDKPASGRAVPTARVAARQTVAVHPAFARKTGVRGWWIEFRRWPVIPAAIVVLLVVAAIFAPLLAPRDPTKGSLRDRNQPPAWSAEGTSKHLLGTDPLGRDLLSRVIYGARISLMVAAIVLTFGAIGGTLLGLVSGWFGGQVDEIAMRFVDFTYAIPFILVALVVVIVLGQSLAVIIALLVVFSWNSFARLTRGETLKLKNEAYVDMARIAGASTGRILSRHLLPGVINTVLVLVSLRVGSLILTEAVLSFLGVGVPPPTPAWGLMVSDGRDYIDTAWWVTVFPGAAIFLTVLAFNFLGDWLRDHFDPRLRQSL